MFHTEAVFFILWLYGLESGEMVKKLIVKGGNPLVGDCAASGAKNAVLPIIAACCLIKDEVILFNCPDITDVHTSIEIINSLGGNAAFESGVLTINCKDIFKNNIEKEAGEKMRSSVTFCGSLLGRLGEVAFCRPGGCVLGKRPIDLHISAFKALGAEVLERKDGFCIRGRLTGAEINLPLPSVGATQNIILAACLAEGKATIKNPSLEPETLELISFLNRCGAMIRIEFGKIIICGQKELKGCCYSVMADRIEAGTYIFGAIMTGGKVCINGITKEELGICANICEKTGSKLRGGRDFVEITAKKPIRSIPLTVTKPHPGFPTDLQPQLTALLSLARGKSVIKETLFESRNRHIEGLLKFGADIKENDGFIINGVKGFNAANVKAYDLRCGAALLLAALAAEGESSIENADYILRGYEKIEDKIKSMGGNIKFL